MDAKDYFGNKLEVGDIVAVMSVGHRYFVDGVITNISNKKLRIETVDPVISCNKKSIVQFHDQVIKKP